jgi:hypothetical protein
MGSCGRPLGDGGLIYATGERRYETQYADNFHQLGIGYRTAAEVYRDAIIGPYPCGKVSRGFPSAA